jgi:thiamine-phosphate pyrophosphorylase
MPTRGCSHYGTLYLVLEPEGCPLGWRKTVVEGVLGGVGIVQLRDKGATDAEFLPRAKELAVLCRELDVPLILNDRVHLVEASGARGVHLGEDDMAPEEARRILGPGVVIGLSTHDRGEVAAAAGRGADYVGLGPMFATRTKVLRRTPGGPALLRSVLGATDLPLYPIGGITAENLPSLVAAGARRAAVSSAICGARDPRAAAAALGRILA